MQQDVQHVFLVGAKGIGFYGGYETFVYKLTEYHQNDKRIKYHVACKANGQGCMDEGKLRGLTRLNETEFLFHNAHCYQIRVPEGLGPAQALFYDIEALKESIRIIKRKNISHPIIYIMACRVGLWIRAYYKELHKLGGKMYLNPDGHEWMRAKWPWLVRKYWKLSEKLMVKNADLVICDSINIEKYIKDTYGKNIDTTYIAYGCETRRSELSDQDYKFIHWMQNHGLKEGQYYLAVGRFIPENNYETMICEFMKSHSKKDFAIITTNDDRFLSELNRRLDFKKDSRIKFVGTVYDQELLMKIRENAYGYFHGHEVGGTNPSLLEALGSTKINLLLDVAFNKEVAGNAALYWNKKDGSLAKLIDAADKMDEKKIEQYGLEAKKRIKEAYSWGFICDRYATCFLN